MAVWLKVVFAGLILVALYFTILQMKLPSCIGVTPSAPSSPALQPKPIKPVVKIYTSGLTDNHLHIVKDVFREQGYIIEGHNAAASWDVLWSHVYPFSVLRKEITRLKPHQKVNHFSGNLIVTQKSLLVTLSIDTIPKSFVMPSQKEAFLEYNKKNKGKIWTQKSGEHRGIQVVNVSNLNLESRDTFIQEYIINPLVISGRKFDIGVYVILTSVNPLRVYMYSGDILLRFCKHKYYPFNSSFIESYVVGDDYLPVWEIPDLQKYFIDLNYTAKDTLNSYLLQQKKDPDKMWSQIIRTVQDVFIKTEDDMTTESLKLGSLRNCFELVRFDFLVDENLNVFLLEVNMSPNLSAAHFLQNRLLYEQVMYNVLSIVGLTRKYPNSFLNRNELEVSEKDIQVFPEECSSQACEGSCRIQKCKVCNPCMTKEMKAIAKAAYLEHMNRNKFRRVIPNPVDFKTPNRAQFKRSAQPTEMNLFMDRWFKGKCLQDLSFCQ